MVINPGTSPYRLLIMYPTKIEKLMYANPTYAMAGIIVSSPLIHWDNKLLR